MSFHSFSGIPLCAIKLLMRMSSAEFVSAVALTKASYVSMAETFKTRSMLICVAGREGSR